MRDTKTWEAGKGLFIPLQPSAPSGGLCSQQEHPGLAGLAEAGSGVRSVPSLLSPLTHYSQPILPAVLLFLLQNVSLPAAACCTGEPNGGFPIPRKAVFH